MRDAVFRIRLFGRLRELGGGEALEVPVSSPAGRVTVADLRRRVMELSAPLAPALAGASVKSVVNLTLVADEAAVEVTPEDEIAFLPPLSGG